MIVWVTALMLLIAVARTLRVEPPRSVFLPFSSVPLPELCAFYRQFAIDCPGCGLTRSFVYGSQLQWSDAWKSNPAGALLFASVMLLIPWRLTQWFFTRHGRSSLSTVRIEAGWLTIIALVMMLHWCFKTLL